MEKPYVVTESEQIYKGKIIEVLRDTITLPEGKLAKREVVKHCAAAAVVAIDEEGRIILVKQYRHPVGEEVYELPAGLVEEGENPAVCAARELEEETAIKCDSLEFICKMGSSVGFCDEMIYIYLANGLSKGVLGLDEHEYIDVYRFTPEEAMEMINKGEIYDAKTIIGILSYINRTK